jgi:hypothetical protein
VSAEEKWQQSSLIQLKVGRDQATALFAIVHKELFLEIQSTWPEWFLYTRVHQPRWDIDAIQELLKKNPELAGMLPDPKRRDGGIKWLLSTSK